MLGNSENEPNPNNTVNAYGQYSSSSTNRRLVVLGGVLFLVLLFRNAVFRDYNNETRSYLTSVGRTDVIDTILPKTPTELKLEKIGKDELLKQVANNMTILIEEMNDMKNEIENLKNNSKINN